MARAREPGVPPLAAQALDGDGVVVGDDLLDQRHGERRMGLGAHATLHSATRPATVAMASTATWRATEP